MIFFFFSSRRRHTRYWRDWSSRRVLFRSLRTQLKEQITAINELGLTAARADDAAFFLELFYRNNGYTEAEVRYAISGNRLRLDIDEGQRITLGTIHFIGNENLEIGRAHV